MSLFICKHPQAILVRSRQQGAVLIVGLIILLVITLIGTSGITTVTLDEKMSSNMQNANKAFQGAEAMLAECEAILRDNRIDLVLTGATELGVIPDIGILDDATQWWNDPAIWQANGYVSTNNTLTRAPNGLAALPNCIVEFIGGAGGDIGNTDPIQPANFFRVTAFSVGADNTTSSMVQSIFLK